jgi:hypothetical protein
MLCKGRTGRDRIGSLEPGLQASRNVVKCGPQSSNYKAVYDPKPALVYLAPFGRRIARLKAGFNRRQDR